MVSKHGVQLSEVACSLEEKISLKKMIAWLSRNLDRRGLAQAIGEAVPNQELKLGRILLR